MKRPLQTAVAASMAALLLCLNLSAGCGNTQSAAVIAETPSLLEPLEVSVNSVPVGYHDLLVSSYYEATVVPYVEEYIFTIDGSITKIYYELGDTVEEGALLAELNHEKIDAQIEALENKINSKKKAADKDNSAYTVQIENLRLKKSQIKSGAIKSSNPSGDMAVIDCDIAIYETRIRQNTENLSHDILSLEEELELLKESYDDYFLYAPMRGEVVYISTDSSIRSQATVIAVADLDTKYIQADVAAEYNIYNAYDVYALHDGKSYDIMHVPTIYDTTCKNLVSAKGRFANFFVSGSSMDEFNYGDYVLICVDTTYIEAALSVPNTALYNDSTGTYVYLVSEDGVRTRKYITTGITDTIYTIVTDGLKEGDIIYVPN